MLARRESSQVDGSAMNQAPTIDSRWKGNHPIGPTITSERNITTPELVATPSPSHTIEVKTTMGIIVT